MFQYVKLVCLLGGKNDSFAKADVTIKYLYTGVSNYVNSIMVKIHFVRLIKIKNLPV